MRPLMAVRLRCSSVWLDGISHHNTNECPGSCMSQRSAMAEERLHQGNQRGETKAKFLVVAFSFAFLSLDYFSL